MRITSKGQVTIPASIRRKAGFLPETEVEIVMENGKVILRKRRGPTSRGERLLKAMRGKADQSMSTEEIMALTRDES